MLVGTTRVGEKRVFTLTSMGRFTQAAGAPWRALWGVPTLCLFPCSLLPASGQSPGHYLSFQLLLFLWSLLEQWECKQLGSLFF